MNIVNILLIKKEDFSSFEITAPLLTDHPLFFTQNGPKGQLAGYPLMVLFENMLRLYLKLNTVNWRNFLAIFVFFLAVGDGN